MWLAAGGVLIAAAAVAQGLAPGSTIATLLTITASIWLVVSAIVLLRSFWLWLTYRVGMRLFISYLLIGGSTFFFCAALASFVLYMLAGQYASQSLNTQMRQLAIELSRTCQEAARAHAGGRTEAAIQLLDGLETDTTLSLPRIDWAARLGESEVRSPGTEALTIPTWLEASPFAGPVFSGETSLFLVGLQTTETAIAVVIPLDADTARALSQQLWFDVNFLPVTGDSEDDLGIHVETTADTQSGALVVQPGSTSLSDLWQSETKEGASLFERDIIFWFRATVDVRNLVTGERHEDRTLVSLLRTSPSNAWSDFTHARYTLGSHLVKSLFGIASFFLVLYGISAGVAVAMILSITRSTARLTRGAREVARGNFEHQVAIKRPDQLGDLALAFNQMTQSVQHMLADVAEKERLAHELQLAREIQVSLLPDSQLDHGGVTLRAEFRPAEEVGGDYFDVFALSADRLVLTIGDVAGHGLHTGLLMAALKSSVAALVHEGYRGEELLLKVGHLLQLQGQSRVMVTMAVVELDLDRNTVRVSNAGHPPPYLITPSGEVVELLAGSLPLGSPLCRPAGLEHAFKAGSRLVAYSDGLVEGANRHGEPFGYEALTALLQNASGLDGAGLAKVVLAAFDHHTEGQPVADDLTLLVLERAGD